MATYNGERWLDEQLQSIAKQTHPPDELIICDDRSTDATKEIISRFTQSSLFPVRWSVNDQRLGPAQNFARAISLCTGDLIALADQDDLWHPDKLHRLQTKFASDPSTALVFSDLRLIDQSSNPTGKTQWQLLGFNESSQRKARQGKLLEVLLKYNVVSGASLAFRSTLRDTVLPIPDHWMHDEWISLIASATAHTALIEDTLQDYRIHPDQQVGPAVQGPLKQLAHARSHMNKDYFARAVQRSHAARDRLASLPPKHLNPDALSLLDERIQHDQTRLNMRKTRAMRSPLVLRELFQGRYHRFAYGLKSALQDLLLR
jgi:glycosyltransferase involved in cell wall biosynthesis